MSATSSELAALFARDLARAVRQLEALDDAHLWQVVPGVTNSAGNLLLHRASSEGAAPAPVVSTETTFRSDGPILRVHVVQAFRNPFRDPQEGLYVIQLPPQATLERILVSVRPSAERNALCESSFPAPPCVDRLTSVETPVSTSCR